MGSAANAEAPAAMSASFSQSWVGPFARASGEELLFDLFGAVLLWTQGFFRGDLQGLSDSAPDQFLVHVLQAETVCNVL